MQFFSKLVWPLPALVVWAAAWGVFWAAGHRAPWWVAMLLACVLGCGGSLWGATWWRRAMIAAGFPVSFVVLSAGQLPAWGWLLPLLLLLLIYPLNAWRDAPVFPTPQGALDGLAPLLPMPSGALGLDAGCGAGDGLVALRRAWPEMRWHGLEWSWPLRAWSALRCPWARIRQGDIWDADWAPYDLVYLFQRPESMSRAAVKAMTEMHDGSWLVSLNFPLPDVEAAHQVALPDGREVYAYRLPIAEIDHASVEAQQVADLRAELVEGAVQVQSLYPRKHHPGRRNRA